MPSAAKTLTLIPRDRPFVDAAWTAKHSEAHVRTGSNEDSVNAEVELCIPDGQNRTLIYWKMDRAKIADGVCTMVEDHPYPHVDLDDFAVDEIEAFATALYLAVQNAKKAGYLPISEL